MGAQMPPQGPPAWPPPPPPPGPPPPWGQAPAPPPRSPGTDGFAIASLVLGIVGGSILAIIFGFVARSRIKRSGASGGGMATAGIVLGFVWLALCGGIIALAVSGVFDSNNADDFAGPEKPVAQTVDDVEKAFRDKDGDRACNELFTPSFKERLTSPGKTCAQVVEEGDEGKIQAEIDVASISIVGNRAIVSVDEGDTPEIWRMLRTDRWRVDDIVER